jgi:carbon-monoxide dehydrogenase medium subunit
MHAFDHYTPKSLPETLTLLNRLNERTDDPWQVIAGGTDLMLKMKADLVIPATIINIKQLPELKGITYDKRSGLLLGALTTLRELTRSPIILEHYPCLAQTAGLMASEQIRSFATLGGNLCNASPSADLAPPLIALGATAHIAGPEGRRELLLEDFFLGPSQSALQPGELLQKINVPPPAGETIYIKQAPRAYMDIAVVGVGLHLEMAQNICRAVSIVLAAVAPIPLRVRLAEAELTGQPLTSEHITRAAKLAAEACSPIDDVRGSSWYRRRMVEVATRRGLTQLGYRF